MIKKEISNQILTIGPDYRYPSGGIAQLLNIYSNFFTPYNFIASVKVPLEKEGCKVIKFLQLLLGIIKMLYYFITKPIKIVHIHTTSGISFFRESIFIILAFIFKKKIILHIHSNRLIDFYNEHPIIIDYILKKADNIITIASIWELFLKNKNYTNVITIPNPIDLPICIENKKTNKLQILYLAKLCEYKGIYDLLECLRIYKKEFQDKILLTVGGNGEINKFKKYIIKHGLSNLVKYEGWVLKEDKAKLLSQTDIFILPSHIEGLGIAILEAMSYKKPVIATNVGGIPEIVYNMYNGILINPCQPKEIYDAIYTLMHDSDLRTKMGFNGYNLSMKYWPDKVEKDLSNLYLNTLNIL